MASTLVREAVRFLEVKPATGTRRKALHALVVGTVTIGVLSLFFGIPMALTGMNGIFVALGAFDRSQRSRIVVLSGIAIAYTVLVTLGALTSLLPVWGTVLVIPLLAAVVAFGYHALLSDPPGPMLLVMGLCAASYIPTLGVPIGQLVLITALSMVLGCGTSVLMQQTHRRAAVERQVGELRTAVDRLERGERDQHDEHDEHDEHDDDSPPDLGTLRDAAFGALFQAQASLVASMPRRRDSPQARAIEAELHALHLRLFRLVAATELPWSHLDDRAVGGHYVGAPKAEYLLRWSLSLASPAFLAARRMGLAMLVGGAFSTALHFSHPYWAQMTAALVLSTSTDRITSTLRAVHRMVGTAVGVLLFFGLHLLHPHPVVVAAIIIACGALTQLLAPRHYALASVVITPMPLLMAGMHLTRVEPLMTSRLLETVIGAAAAMLVLWVQGPSTAIVLVRRQFRRALLALREVLRQMVVDPDQAASLTSRRNLHYEQLAAAKALAMVDPAHPEALRDWDGFEAALGELTFTVLVAARTDDPAHALQWLPMARELDQLLDALPPVSRDPIDVVAATRAIRRVLQVGRVQPDTSSGSESSAPKPG